MKDAFAVETSAPTSSPVGPSDAASLGKGSIVSVASVRPWNHSSSPIPPPPLQAENRGCSWHGRQSFDDAGPSTRKRITKKGNKKLEKTMRLARKALEVPAMDDEEGQKRMKDAIYVKGSAKGFGLQD